MGRLPITIYTAVPNRPRKIFSKYAPEVFEAPDLVQVQLDSYKWFLDVGFKELLNEVSPIEDWTGKELELRFLDFKLEEPKYSERVARERNITYEAPLRIKISLTHKRDKHVEEQEVYLTDFPLMTSRGTFIINGVERVVISQLIRSPGVFFTLSRANRFKRLFGAKIIPSRGAWLEFETESSGVISVRIDRKRKVPVTSLLRAFGMSSDEEIKKAFEDVETDPDMKYIVSTIVQDAASNEEEGLIEVYKRIRPGDPATPENSRQMVKNMFMSFARYDLSRVGRHRMNQRFATDYPLDEENRTLKKEDLVAVLREIIKLNNDPQAQPDNIDHLGNRRVKTLGELLQDKLRLAFSRMERTIKDRMSTIELETAVPAQFVNSRPIVAGVKEFFSSGQMSQFMDQINPLAELEHKRRLSALGPGGLTRERASFEVRDVHPSHYGRICPIETPEGPNIGLVGHLSLYAKVSPLGFILTPYRTVRKGAATDEVAYMNATEENQHIIANAGALLDEKARFIEEMIPARIHGEVGLAHRDDITLMDVSAKQPFSVATSLIPFLENDDANRALMGSNMQRQAVPIISPEAPIIGTGLEGKVAHDSGVLILAKESGIVDKVDASTIVIKDDDGERHEYQLLKFIKSNQFTAINQRPIVHIGQKIKKGDVLADGPATQNGELALGRNLVVAFLSFEGANFEDAVVLSERLVKEDLFTSIHIEDYSIDVRETKLGPEVTTYDIPNRSEAKLKDLDEEGIVRIGAEVRSQDILVGKISPKGESDLTAEERLLKAIFGEKSRDVKDTSLTLDHGKTGRVVAVKIFSRDQGDKLNAGVIKSIQVSVAQMRKIQVGDKLAGRHGNKGVISTILPEEDMPYLPDGRPVDMILSPLGIISRMNIGQVLETHLGWAASKLGYRAAVPSMAGPTEAMIKEQLKEAGLPEDGKIVIYDGRTGRSFEQKTTVGVIYFMKLSHMVEDKMHMRSIGPYSLITQQPLGGKAQFGGQRFGEMEVWALEGYGAAYTLQEMLTIKSDDVQGRAKTYESIINGEKIRAPHLPESFKVLLSEIKGLGLNVELREQ
ncbi:MAG: DNA-directed RNA polymerase subunit beta [Candidatus Yanofskybacteria bacterium RIFCSPLOWO2_01_FULL_49_25]|uniref:DNA-directed RNA polymerase subunit beta n=1 Tax=Candidatus Yanofskybacteria bacterium RIFCSPLOWO2_01_FULL_49_25 TaxID=1802701 RepID=A0A1F8GUT0_9BACT|nr:MAG: DNA-directed RNA polymerase subunit beta [Candidatus Yanofskybacteria bacterium RIFCSPLOWO2_01_FULL_49_25]